MRRIMSKQLAGGAIQFNAGKSKKVISPEKVYVLPSIIILMAL